MKLEPDVITYGAGISACEKGGQWPEALSLLRQMGDVKLERDVITYSAGISACEKGGQWPEAVSLLRAGRQRGGFVAALPPAARARPRLRGGQRAASRPPLRGPPL